MSLLDIVLVLALGMSAMAGHRMGLLLRAAGLIGFFGGLAVSTFTVPLAVEVLAPSTTAARLLTPVAAVVLSVLVVSIVAQAIAMALRRAIAETPLSSLDRAGGAVAGVAGMLVLVWFAAPLAGMIPGSLARQVRGSLVVGLVTDVAPTAPNPLAALQSFVSDSRFPEVFSNLQPAPVTQPPPDAIPVSQDVVAAVSASSVKIEAGGCGSAFAGSGWTVGENLVITNAHVVAGADDVQVLRADGTRADATVLAFDDARDVALLEVPGLGQPALRFGTAEDGEGAATFGHPGGQDELRVAPARVGQQIRALGRDIYGQDSTERQVIVLGASLLQGDSGSVVADGDGTVIGTVFAISPDDPNTAYALANEEIQAVLDGPRDPGNTGRCT